MSTNGSTGGFLDRWEGIRAKLPTLAGRSLKRPGSRRGLRLGGLSTAVLFASAYLGGDLVYHRGWRVKPLEREEIERQGIPESVHEDDFVLRGSARSTSINLRARPL